MKNRISALVCYIQVTFKRIAAFCAPQVKPRGKTLRPGALVAAGVFAAVALLGRPANATQLGISCLDAYNNCVKKCDPSDPICRGDCYGDEQTCLGALGVLEHGNFATAAYSVPTGQLFTLATASNLVLHVGLYDGQNVAIASSADIANVQIYSVSFQQFAASSNFNSAPWSSLGTASASSTAPGVWDFTLNTAGLSNTMVLRAALNTYGGDEFDALAVLQPAQAYTNPIPAGYSFIAHQFDHGSNTLNDVSFLQVSPNLSDPAGVNNAVLYVSNGVGFDTYKYWTSADAEANFGLNNGDGWYDVSGTLADVVWNPGQGMILYNPNAQSGSLTFTGVPHVPVLPYLPSGYDAYNLIGLQTNGTGTFEAITGISPDEGDLVLRHVAGQPASPVAAPNYTVFTFAGGNWSPAVPVLANYEAAWFYLPSRNKACVSPPANLALWLPFDETSGTTSVNLAPGGNNGTHVNSPGVNLGSYVANSLNFNGANQYVAVPDYPAINPGTGNLSIDAWVIRSSQSGNTVRVIVDKRDLKTTVGYSLAVSFGNLVFQLSGTNYRDTGTVPADDKWHFVAVTVNRTSTTGGKFYVDGLPTGTFDPTGQPGSLNNTAPFMVASSLLGGNIPWLGSVDEVEFFRRALAATEIQSIYKAGTYGKCKHACVPVPANVALWLPFDETSGTASVNLAPGGNNGTHINGPSVNLGSYVANSLNFNGANQYVSVPDYAAINPGTGDLSIDAWVKRSPGAPNSPPSIIVDKRNPSSGIGYSLSLSYGNLIFQLADGSYTNYRDTGGVVPADNKWHFVAVTVTRNSTTGGQFYVDGVATSTFNPTGRPGSLNNTGAFWVGASPMWGNVPWLGGIDEVEFFHRALTPTEVQSIYTAGSNGKCKPGCVAAPANLGLWLPFDETSGLVAENLVPGGNNGTKINSPSINLGGYVAHSLCFNGANQYVTVPDYPAINPGTGNLSLDAWVKRAAGAPNSPPSIIADKRDPNTGVGYSLSLSYGQLIFQLSTPGYGFTNYRDTIGAVPADNQWHFVAVTVTRNNTMGGQFFVDGVPTTIFDPTGEPGSLNNTSPFQVASSLLAGGDIPWLGCIDEVEFFQRALAATEIQGIYNAGSYGKCKHGCQPAPVSLVMWLPLDETSGTTTANYVSPANYGTKVNTPGVVSGAYVLNSLNFNGVNQYVTVPNYPAIEIGTNDLTIDAWVNRPINGPNSLPSVILDKRDPNTGIGYSLSVSYGRLILTMSGVNYATPGSTIVPPDGHWHFVAVSLSQKTGTPLGSFYIDGVLVSTFAPAQTNLKNTNHLAVGTGEVGGNRPWLGGLDEIEIFNRALSAAELQGIYNAGTFGKCKYPYILPPNQVIFNGLLNQALGIATLSTGTNPFGSGGLTVANLGSSGQDGVSINLGRALSCSVSLQTYTPIPVGGWLQADAIGSLGGVPDSPVGTLRVTHDSTNVDGYQVTADLSALGSPTERVEVWNNHSLVAAFPGQSAGAVARMSSLPSTWGKLGPGTGGPIYGCLVIYNPNPTNIWVNSIHYIGDEIRVLQETGLGPDYLSGFKLTAGNVDLFNITQETTVGMPTSFSGLLNTPVGNGSLVEGADGALIVSNLGSSGQDGVSINLGRAVSCLMALAPVEPIPVGGWLQAAATGSVGGVTNHPAGTLRVTHVNTGIQGYQVSADLSALGSPTERLEVWSQGTMVATFTSQPTGVVALASSLPIYWGKLGPVTGLPPYYGCLVIQYPDPIDLWVTGIHYVGDELRVLQNAGPAVDYLSAFTITAGNVGAFNITQETSVGTSAMFAGLLNTPLGNAYIGSIGTNGTDGINTCNLGSSGQDGVSLVLGQAKSCSVTLAPVTPVPLGGWLQADAVGSLGGVTNSPVGTLRVTHDSTGDDGYQVTADLSALGSPTARLEVWSNHSLVAAFAGQPAGIVARMSSLPSTWGKLGSVTAGPIYGCLVVYNPHPTNIWVNGIYYLGDEFRVLQEAGPIVDYLSAFNITSGNVGTLNITQETAVPLHPVITTTFTSSSLTLQWSGGGVLQQCSDLHSWSDLPGVTSPYTTPALAAKKFYRVRQ